jgi:hypothetical protein
MNKYTIVYVDDWEQLYVDGKISYGNHSLDIGDLQQFCPKAKVGEIEYIQADESDEMIANGNWPDNLSDVPTEGNETYTNRYVVLSTGTIS